MANNSRDKWAVFVVGVLLVLGIARASDTRYAEPEARLAAAGGHQTARAALDRVIAKAKVWKADAELTQINAKVDRTGQADNNGAAPGDGWTYFFASAASKKALSIQVYSGGLTTLESDLVAGATLKSLPQTFIDSDQAIAEAAKNGFSGKRDGTNMGLDDQPHGLPESFCWVVEDDDGTLYFVSAKSGKLLGKM